MQLYQSYRDIHLIPGHYICISPSGIAFKFSNILAPYIMYEFNILDCHLEVLDLVAVNNPLVILSWRIYEFGVDIPRKILTNDISRCETLFVLKYGVLKKWNLDPLG